MEKILIYWLLWLSFWTIIYTFIGFPLLIILRAGLQVRPVNRAPLTPKVSMIIAAYNETPVIKQKLENAFSLDYPTDSLEIIVASDGSDDGTEVQVRQCQGKYPVNLLTLPRQGKNLTINSAVEVAHGDILMFTDADTMLMPDALRHLMAAFNDPEVGAVAGDYRHDTDIVEGANERDFWNFERILKRLQSRAGSITSAWGPIYAIRHSLFKPIPIGVTDDYFTSAQALVAHTRLVFEERAIATGPVASSAKVEYQRKLRIITAGLRGVWQTRSLLNPFEYGFVSIQLFSHKVLRRLMGIPLLILFFTSLILWPAGWLYRSMAVAQLVFHGAAMLGFFLRGTVLGQLKMLRLPFFLDMVYAASTLALFNLLRGMRHDLWTPQNDQ